MHAKGGVEQLNTKKRKLSDNDEKVEIGFEKNEVAVQTTSLLLTKQNNPYNKHLLLNQSNILKILHLMRVLLNDLITLKFKNSVPRKELEQKIKLIRGKHLILKFGVKQNLAERHKVVNMYNKLVLNHDELKNQLSTSCTENLELLS